MRLRQGQRLNTSLTLPAGVLYGRILMGEMCTVFEDTQFAFRGHKLLVLDETGLVLSAPTPSPGDGQSVTIFRYDGEKRRTLTVPAAVPLAAGQVVSLVGIAHDRARDDGQFAMCPLVLINHTTRTRQDLCTMETLRSRLGLTAKPVSLLFVFLLCLLAGGLISFFVLGSYRVFAYSLVVAALVAGAVKLFDWYRQTQARKEFATAVQTALAEQEAMLARLVLANTAVAGDSVDAGPDNGAGCGAWGAH